ncbi:hypothetical protein SLS56_004045 [Neofusicoccum ribis]|uniref:Shelterin complex subunit TPP1/Est3 domain-containing protein n=3 Tax=Neofusicoccum TaxID=407951 RepID=A0ABR3SXE5_9PEZI
MGSLLKPWLGEEVEEEVDMALEYWETDPKQRTRIEHSQAQEAMFEDDGSNLRIQVQMALSARAHVQIVNVRVAVPIRIVHLLTCLQFTQVEDDEPIDAIVSDSVNSIKVRFSNVVERRFEEKHKRPITSNTRGGIMYIKEFEIVIPQFGTADEDPVFLLVSNAIYEGSPSSQIFGRPTPIQSRQKMKRLLERFHKVKFEENSDGAEIVGSGMESDDDAMSQGEPNTVNERPAASQTQFGTQAAFSQVPFMPRREKGSPKGIKMEPRDPISQQKPSEQGNTRQPLQQKPAPNLQQILGLLSARPRGADSSKKAPMPHSPAPPKTSSGNALGSQSQSGYQSPRSRPQGGRNVVDENDEPAVVNAFADTDAPISLGMDDPTKVHGLGNQEAADEHPSADAIVPLDSAGPIADAQRMDVVHNNTPTSYQLPIPSTSTVPTTNSSVPSVVQTIEKDITAGSSQEHRVPLIYHKAWNFVLPATRSACRIPQDQAEILKKPCSVLPPRIGHQFPVGNMPNTVLASVTSQVEERRRKEDLTAKTNEPINHLDAVDSDTESILEKDVPDAMDDILDTDPPQSTQSIDWSPSPPRLANRAADLPPDSSLPEKEDADETGLPSEAHKVKNSKPKGPSVPSSPPGPSSPDGLPRELMDDDDESDLETSVPKAYIRPKQVKLASPSPNAKAHVPAMKRQISSSGKPYTHLHAPKDTRPWQVITSSSSGRIQSSTQQYQSPSREDKISSSAPVIPCSYEAIRSPPLRTPQNIVGVDGAGEGATKSPPDEEDELIQRQIQNEMNSQSSQRQHFSSAPSRNQPTPSSPSRRDEDISERRAPSTESPSSRRHSGNPPIKREAHSPPPPDEPRKRAKKVHSNFHFSQDIPLSQNPSDHLREQRRQFFAKREHEPSHLRQKSNSSASGLSEPESALSPANHLQEQRRNVSTRIKQESDDEQNVLRRSTQPSGSLPRPLVSSDVDSDMSQPTTPAKVKAEYHDDDQALLPIMETEDVSRSVSHDAMEVDVPAQEQFHMSRAGTAPHSATNEEPVDVTRGTSIVEETEFPVQREMDVRKAQVAVKAAAGVPVAIGSPRTRSAVSKNGSASKLSQMAKDKSQNRYSMSNKAYRRLTERLKKKVSKVQQRLRGQTFSADGALTSTQKRCMKEQSKLFRQAEKHGIKLDIDEFKLPYQKTGQPDPMEGISEYEDDLDALSDGSSIHDSHTRKWAKRPIPDDSDDEVGLDASSSVDSGNKTQAAPASTSREAVPHASQATRGDRIRRTKTNATAPVDQEIRPPAEKTASTTAGPLKPTTGADLAQPPQDTGDKGPTPLTEVGPSGTASDAAKPSGVLAQFSQVYPEYTGNHKHFLNLCHQLDWMKKGGRPLHPYLWDDYIIRHQIEYKIHMEECSNEGTDPLPWSKYYVDKILMPRFNKGVMNPDSLEKLFSEQEKPLRPVIHKNVSHFEPIHEKDLPPRALPRVDGFPRGRDSYRPDYSKPPQRIGANNIPVSSTNSKRVNNQQQGSSGTQPQQQSKQPSAPSVTLPASSRAAHSAAPGSVQPPFASTANSAAHAKPTQPALTAPSKPFKSPGAVPQALPRAPASNKATIATSKMSPASAPPSKVTKAASQTAAKRLNGMSAPSSASATTAKASLQPPAKTLNGMPAPPPPASSAASGKEKGKNMFQMFKERYNKPRPGGSRAGSTV